MALPGKRIIRRIAKRGERERILLRLHQISRRDVYAALLDHARTHRKRDGTHYSSGWAYYAFLEIFGSEPRPQDQRVEPQALPDNLIDEWKASRERPREHVIMNVKPAPLLAAIERPQLKVDPTTGFVEGTLMTVADFFEDWK